MPRIQIYNIKTETMTSFGASDESVGRFAKRQGAVDKQALAEYRNRQTDGFSSKYSHTDKRKGEMQILNDIDILDDPNGR